ncbi:MAG: MBL fold metallo-hydrolase [Bacteroidaceae bacterium]|nr:MBL fold metallo-hydrolase [Bacteroidaceae bacterium]
MDIKVIASGSSGNCYKVSDGSTTLLLDAGIPFKEIQKGVEWKMTAVDGCIITHRHGDHSKSIPELLRRGFDVYSNNDVCSLFPLVQKVYPMKKFVVKTFEITPFPCTHDVECYGYLLHSTVTDERLLYFTDTAYVKYQFSNIDYIMAEANYSFDVMAENSKSGQLPWNVSNRVLSTHMSIDNLIRFLQSNIMHKVNEIYLLHLSDANSNAEEFKLRVQKETGAIVYVC